MNKLFLAVIIGGLFYLAGQYIASQPQRIEQEVEANRQISVEGRGEVTIRPDVAQVTLGVTTGPQPTAARAMEILAERFDAVLVAVTAEGIADDDVTTSNLSLNPVYDYAEGRQQLRGFEATESVTIKVRDLGAVGNVVSRATVEGVNQIGGIHFEADDPDEAQRQAREKAIENAQENAEALARALGVRLGRVKTFSVNTQTPGQPPVFAQADLVAAEGRGGAVPVPAGTQDITAFVTVTYELQ